MTLNNNKNRILGKYAIEDIEVKELEGGKAYGFFDHESGEQVFPQTWADAGEFSFEGYACVKANDYWGLIDTMGVLVIPCKWQESHDEFHDGLCGVKDNNNLWGFVNNKGDIVLPCRWKKVSGFCKGVCVVCDENDTWSFVDSRGNYLYTPNNQWKDILYWSESLLPVQNKEGLWGFVNTRNKLCIPYKWSEVKVFTDGRCAVKTENGRWGAIDTNGSLVIPGEWNEPFLFVEGSAFVEKNGCLFKIGKQGNIINDYGNIEREIGRIENIRNNAKIFRLPMMAGFAGFVALALFCYIFSNTIGYTNYNPTNSYSLFDSQQWLGWIVAVLGGLHTYDLLIPLTLITAFIYKVLACNNDFTDFELQSSNTQGNLTTGYSYTGITSYIRGGGWLTKLLGEKNTAILGWALLVCCLFFSTTGRNILLPACLGLVITDLIMRKKPGAMVFKENSLRHFLIVILLLFLPLKIIYFSLFAVNYLTAGESHPQVLNIIGTSDEYHKGGHNTYYLIADIDNGIPYQIKTSKSIYDNYNSGSTNILADVRQGCIGFSFISDHKVFCGFVKSDNTSNIAKEDEKHCIYDDPIMSTRNINNNIFSEIKHIKYMDQDRVTCVQANITLEHLDIPKLQRAISNDLFGEECDNVIDAYERYISQYDSVAFYENAPSDYPYLYINISSLRSRNNDRPILRVEKIYAENMENYQTLLGKLYTIVPKTNKVVTSPINSDN